jgi:type VI secretion system protein ImpG
VQEPLEVKRGSEVQTPGGKYQVKYKVSSGPREKARVVEKTEHAEFIFRTTQDLVIRPMQLKEAVVEDTSDAASALVLKIHPFRNVSYATLDLKRLTFFLYGSEFLRYSLLLFLNQYVDSVYVRETQGENTEFREVKPFKIGIPGLSDVFEDDPEDYAVIPYARQIFTGYRMLQEYFAFPDRFFFVAL